MDYNLTDKDPRIDFIYDDSHKEQIEKLLGIIEFPKKEKNDKAENNQRLDFLNINSIQSADEYIRQTLRENDDFVHQKLDALRLKWKSDPSLRSFENRIKQAIGFSINATAFIGKQCVNLIRKPIALAVNITKIGYHSYRILKSPFDKTIDLAQEKKAIMRNIKDASKDLKDTLIAGATLLLVIFSTPFLPQVVAASIAGVGIVGGACSLGIMKAAAISNSAAGLSLQGGQAAVESAYRAAQYNQTDPSRFSEIEKTTLQNLHQVVTSEKYDINYRNKALEKMHQLEEYLYNEQLKKDQLGRKIYSIPITLQKLAGAR
ncbi:MAG: hypothetical protein AABY27_06350, partial [Pseudomonadota bacterium]